MNETDNEVLNEEEKTMIGEMPDCFFDDIKEVGGGSKCVIIPKKLCDLGDYKKGDRVKIWIKKVVEK